MTILLCICQQIELEYLQTRRSMGTGTFDIHDNTTGMAFHVPSNTHDFPG